MKRGDIVRYKGKHYIIHKIDGSTITLTNDKRTEFIGVRKAELT